MFVDPWGLADVPKGGTKPLNDAIDLIMDIIGFKVDYNNGSLYSAPYLANEKRQLLEDNLGFIESYSPELAKLVDEVIISGNGGLQEVSSVLAVLVELKCDIVNGYYMEGEEVIPEDKIRDKYNYYVGTGNIYLAGDEEIDVLGEILPYENYDDYVPAQNVFTGTCIWGYWIKIIYYDMYKTGVGDAFNLDTEDWWEDAKI